MSPSAPQINTLMEEKNKVVIDSVSKSFIIAELILGVNRLPLLGVTNKIYVLSIVCLTLIFNISLFYVTYRKFYFNLLQLLKASDCIRFTIITFLGFLLRARLINFYIDLKKFDEELGSDVKNIKHRKYLLNYLQFLSTLMVLCFNYYKISRKNNNYTSVIPMIVVKLLHCLELNYYIHLFISIIPRTRLINNYMKLLYQSKKEQDLIKIYHTDEEFNDFKKQITIQIDMKKIMDIYNRILRTYNFLYEAIKWQILAFVVVIFINTFILSYHVIKCIIDNELNDGILWLNSSLSFIELVPLFTLCVFADQVNHEAHRLKDLLASRLYENVLGKSCRGTARALLALMKTHDLSFSLFHMFDIDKTLPIRFFSLLVTYLIIWLQFDKVTNPN